ncbi:ergosterol biosynthesis ERG4/ERG24 family-domain-containing protein [Aspergillus alliaceus]|uniref:ergosterol biosynthesis ERG4/ERG24 family-domain-containing protein n=1 Tax=Petromyces alliaceus TaxID=209559 RepID=UPI0012A576AF|nr:ergosterol biosynthesis ERG4/ERG24 family-domain-containing protein [Aspergillus alliaceus]KAB8235607.1 ergosterol biosynthesis ERG4/ERG24 family-domain-containing protein [Aspergillus alliaceus]
MEDGETRRLPILSERSLKGYIKYQLPTPTLFTEVTSSILFTTSPAFVICYWIAYHYFDTSITAAARAAFSEGLFRFFASRFPDSSQETILGYAIWLALQTILYVHLPGRTALSPLTPTSRRLRYKLNSLAVWSATVTLWTVGTASGIIGPACIAGSRGFLWYDIFEGGELHPRIGKMWDWTHFFCTRIGGILAWTLHQTYGYLTNIMVTAVVLRGWVVVDFFVNEERVSQILDEMYGSFGFYNIYGFSAMMLVLWLLQAQYLAKHPNELSHLTFTGAILIHVIGWFIRFSEDNQKVKFRRAGVQYSTWSKKAETIRASLYFLCSGWWGLARHTNCIGSTLYALGSLCSLRLRRNLRIHQCYRDDEKCAVNYGKDWEMYRRRVRWRMIPGVF